MLGAIILDKEKRKKKEDEEKHRLEEAYVEFRETFEDGGTSKISKTFIRGDIVNANRTMSTTPEVYKPAPVQLKPQQPAPTLEQAKLKAQETARKIMEEAAKHKTIPPTRPPKPGTKKVVEKTRMTNLESFKEELKQMQSLREERKGLRQHLQEKLGVNSEAIDRIAPSLDNPYLGSGSNFEYEDDPTTTNLYVCNIPKETQIEDFLETFGTFGPLASAKILYPKPEDEFHRPFLCGFVAYMSRKDSERALCAMHGEKLRGSELRVSWARPVVIPPVPFFVPIALRELAMPDPPSGLPFNAKPVSAELRAFLQKYHDLPRLNTPLTGSDPTLIEGYKKMIGNSVVRVVIPTEKPLLALIHRVVEFLVRGGPLFEAILMAKERNNPMYRFLFENHHPTHVYYRWRLYSILQGEDRHRWRLERFRMFEDGSWWQPPPHSLFEHGMPPMLYDTAYVPMKRKGRPYEKVVSQPRKRNRSADEERTESAVTAAEKNAADQKKWKGVLSDDDRTALEDMLRNLVPEKTSIGDAMCWCVEHAECAKEIVQCIYESLCIKETPLHKKIARIYLTSDILANCSARIKDVFYFRQFFGDVLLKIFTELNETLEGIKGVLKAEQFRQRVMLCFRNWEDHSIYPTEFLINLQNIFLGLTKPDVSGVEMDSSGIDGEPLPAEEFDEDLDGMPLAGEEDIDGIPLDEGADIDGIPMEMEEAQTINEKTNAKQLDTMFKTNSWSTVDPDENGGASGGGKSKWEAVELGSKWDRQEVAAAFTEEEAEERPRLSPMKYHHRRKSSRDQQQPNGNGNEEREKEKSKENEEERRKTLREIEVKVMKLQDELEAKNAENIDDELAKYRKKLMAKMEEKLLSKSSKEAKKEKEKEKKQLSVKEKEREERDGRRDRDRSERDRDRDKERERDRDRGGRHDRDKERERERDRDSRNRKRSRGSTSPPSEARKRR